MPPARSWDLPVTPKGRQTKDGLLDAGEAVAARDGLAGLSVASVTSEAKVAKGTFYVHFADRAAFIEALERRFYARVADRVLDAVKPLPPGRDFLAAALDAYLDACLAKGAIKALLLEARAHGERGAVYTELLTQFEALVSSSLQALALTPVDIHARLLIALASETALIELERGSRVDEARDALRAILPGT
ncbi:TetR/AcrR family transcriptional regulator [Streptomyces sp. NPDC002766]|uniref:TetR/AcrR family transcriptional regulator n=1 Tax=Streptomyces sp. NPDC002766 TaxID=3154429 RepID=UPI0033173DA2